MEKLRQKELANKEPFKVRAYATVIKNLKASEEPINHIDDIKNIKGIGKSIHEKIKEIMETGDLKQLEKFNEQVKIINELVQIHGIGPVKAKELVEEHNIKGIDELKQHPELLNDKQKMGLRYVEDFNQRIPRKEMEKHEVYIREAIQRLNPKITLEIVGSYRRGAKDSGDIDVILTHEDNPENYDDIIRNVVAVFKKDKYLVDDFALGTHKYLGVCRLKRHRTFRRIDFLYATKEVWPFSIMYFTGDREFNIVLRKVALEKGLSLNEYGFKKVKTEDLVDLSLYTEEDVLNHLGFKYIPPNKRTGNEKELETFRNK